MGGPSRPILYEVSVSSSVEGIELGSHTHDVGEVIFLVGSFPTLTKEFPDVYRTFTHAQNN